jgi:hypothetical protein
MIRRSEMDKGNKPTPFGLLFAEPATQPPSPIVPTYDEDTDLSYVEDPAGRRVPYVELTDTIRTETQTRIASEATDEDENHLSQFVGTHTFTEIELEPTDPDPEDGSRLALGNVGTDTVTLIEAEPTDTDPGDDQGYSNSIQRSLAATDTFTKQDREPTDTD